MEYKDLDVWKNARILVKEIYGLTRQFPRDELYGLVAQMRRSFISIPSNIAEGCGRRTAADTTQYLHVARGSLYELETQLYLAMDLGFAGEDQTKRISEQIIACKKLLNGFINYYKAL
ncbi:four helix bundle protein [Sungkyunkwania multivorans]|uniref:Four helix bundle protein n=1 Tax=Sungkyunkwania multivorans TaxID=1173618 RepID=A0ABW3D0X4_9FLAO